LSLPPRLWRPGCAPGGASHYERVIKGTPQPTSPDPVLVPTQTGPGNAAAIREEPIRTTSQDSTPNKEPSGAQKLIGDFAPKLVELTDDVLFGDVWARRELAPRDRSLITCAALITNCSTEQLRAHLSIAKTNGVTETELKEVIIHLAFCAGWPRAISAIMVAKEVLAA
jgi:4-carboxymuconolactone decarboxylase